MPVCSSLCSNAIRLHRHQKPIFLQTLNLSHFTATRAKFARMSSQGADAEAQKLISFSLSPAAALVIQKGDITEWSVDGSSDAIVNPANERMLGGGGADGAIHRAAGPELLEACYKVPEVLPGIRCPTGEARITPGFRVPASHVIHAVGPIYDGGSNSQASLRNAYRNSLMVAKEKELQYVAFPAISCGVFGYPYDEAATIAISTIKESSDGLKEVHFVLFSDDIYNVWVSKAKELLQQ
ncbi:macro domain-containing protein VPA0103 [Rhodamnia argentea]|uniref:Macro domain-containing protein VPA0103 n=1 Tax=Rhodamnia argentea TaxID=178133 RepID=A0A8B8PZY6_9MYRT|nr:macro domain-containing protein VPA0103 [Rhodamnia argentea]